MINVTAASGTGYKGPSKLMDNYGWVQNTSNLSTVRDTVDLIPEEGISHYDLMLKIHDLREANGDLKNKWTWDARCRIKAICATGMVELNRSISGYALTELGRELKLAPYSSNLFRGKRVLSNEEIDIFQKGLLTNPPVIRVLNILNDSRRNGNIPLSKYDVGGQLGFVGDIGFTHLEAEYVASCGASFNDKEGDADKWARTIIRWLVQVGWVIKASPDKIYGKTLERFTTSDKVDRVLQYSAKSATRYIPQEMLCSDHHPFPKVIQQRRIAILKSLSSRRTVKTAELLSHLQAEGFEIDAQKLEFDLINLRQAGINIVNESSSYRLLDKVKLDICNTKSQLNASKDDLEDTIEHYVTKYSSSLPARLIDNLIRYGYAGVNNAALFEASIDKFFRLLGYESTCLGQGHGRVADVIAKCRVSPYPKSYGLIIDAKAYSQYNFPVGDIRKMKEYIGKHGPELLQDKIPKHAFAFISMDFTSPDEHLQEIADETAVNGTAITVFELFKLGDNILQHGVKIDDLYNKFTTNKLFYAG